MVVDLGGPLMRVNLADGYWTPLLFSPDRYEPEVDEVLRHVLRPGLPFLDCGANIGYWSIIAGVRERADVLAVEPASLTFRRLEENRRLNRATFPALRAAIWSSPGARLTLVTHEQRHAGSSVVNRRERIGSAGYSTEEVEAVTLQSLVQEYFPHATRVVVKLDVEDAELEALKGASQVLQERDVLLIYEDHGSDEECVATKAVAAIPGYEVFLWRQEFRKVENVDEVRNLKSDKTTGYMLFAMRTESSFLCSPRSSSADPTTRRPPPSRRRQPTSQ